MELNPGTKVATWPEAGAPPTPHLMVVPGVPGLTLRPLSAGDLPEFARIRALKQVAQYLPGNVRDGGEAARIAEWIIKESAKDWLTWKIGLSAIVEPSADRFIGYCGLHRIDGLGKFEVCYMLAPDYWGRGMASRCVHAVIEYVRTHQLCDEIIGLVPANHSKSKDVLLRNGFTYRWRVNDGTVEIECFRRELLTRRPR